MRQKSSWHLVAFLVLVSVPGSAFAEAMTLITAGGDRMVGEWLGGDEPDTVSWHTDDFAGPFQFSPDALMAIYGSREKPQADAGKNAGLCICELVTGDVLFGMPVSLDEKTLEFAVESEKRTKDSQTVSISRKYLKRLTGPMESNELLVSLPGDGEVFSANKRGVWNLKGGKFVAGSEEAKCFAKLPKLPKRCLIEMEVAWESNTDFAVSLTAQKRELAQVANREHRVVFVNGVGQQKKDEDAGEHSGLRLESWDDRIVLMARTKDDADLLLITDEAGGKKAGSLRLQIYLDAQQKKADVYRDGVFVGNLRLPFGLEKRSNKTTLTKNIPTKIKRNSVLKEDPNVRSKAVNELQSNLEEAGYSVGGIDGRFDAKTLTAVKAFQKTQIAELSKQLESASATKRKAMEGRIAELKKENSQSVAGFRTQRRLETVLILQKEKAAANNTEWTWATQVARLENFEGQLSLESFRISTWNGHTPNNVSETASAVFRMSDASVVTGRVVGWESDSQTFLVAEEITEADGDVASEADEVAEKEVVAEEEVESEKEEESKEEEEEESEETPAEPQRIAITDITEVLFSTGEAPEVRDGREPQAGEALITTRLGTQLVGKFSGVKERRVYIQSDAFDEETSFSLDDVVSANFSAAMETGEDHVAGGVQGTLRLDDSMIKGTLVKATTAKKATCLAWQPALAKNHQPLLATASGTIVYREPVKKTVAKKNPNVPKPRKGLLGGFADAIASVTKGVTGEDASDKPPAVRKGEMMTLELRSGDSIPFQPKRIDEEGVAFVSPLSDVTFVKHDQVKAISLRSKCTPAELTAIKRERLLTVPRRYKDRPPTHLLLSVNKDILRCRLVSMDEKNVTVEMRLTPRRIPRDRIAAIIWLDNVVDEDAKDKSMGEGAADEPALVETSAVEGFHVLATKRGGRRITILPDSCRDDTLHGKNPVLEACQLALAEVDQLAFGSDIKTVIDKLDTSQIVLTSATMPRYLDEEAGGAAETGQESSLVGEPAPPIKLKRLNGKKYDLAKEKGKIIVLDFWATWCGPCIQWMPKADAVVEEFADENVELVAVNLSETKEDIEPLLKRLDLHPTVLLDIDGVVATTYKASAIPQTVVIDREGNVDRVFVGGGKQNEELLRESIKALVEKK